MVFLIFISNILLKIVKFIKTIIFTVLKFLSKLTIYITGEKEKISLKSNLIIHEIIYILWGFISFVLHLFIAFLLFNFQVIQSIVFFNEALWLKSIVIIIPVIMIYNIYFLAYKTIYNPINIITIIPFTIIKMALLSLIIFFLSFPFVYKNNLSLINQKNEVYRKYELIRNENLNNKNALKEIKETLNFYYNSIDSNNQIGKIKLIIHGLEKSLNNTNNIQYINQNNHEFKSKKTLLLTIIKNTNKVSDVKMKCFFEKLNQLLIENEKLKKEMDNKISKSNLLLNKIMLIYENKNFFFNFITLSILFNSIFLIKIALLFFDSIYIFRNMSEDNKVIENTNFS